MGHHGATSEVGGGPEEPGSRCQQKRVVKAGWGNQVCHQFLGSWVRWEQCLLGFATWRIPLVGDLVEPFLEVRWKAQINWPSGPPVGSFAHSLPSPLHQHGLGVPTLFQRTQAYLCHRTITIVMRFSVEILFLLDRAPWEQNSYFLQNVFPRMM